LNGRGSSASVAQSIALFAVVGLGAWLLRRPARRACVGASC